MSFAGKRLSCGNSHSVDLFPSTAYVPTINRRFELGIHNFGDGGSHSAAIVPEGHAPPSPAQFLTGISHDNRMAGELKHFHIIMVVTNGHDLIAPETTMRGPTFESVSFGTARIQDVDHRQISFGIFGA